MDLLGIELKSFFSNTHVSFDAGEEFFYLCIGRLFLLSEKCHAKTTVRKNILNIYLSPHFARQKLLNLLFNQVPLELVKSLLPIQGLKNFLISEASLYSSC